MSEAISARKLRHVEACLERPVQYRTRTTGFEAIDLPYRALPETDLAAVDTATTFLGRPMAAPIFIGAMTGGARLSATINRNLATAAQRVGVGMMLGSQRVMLEDPAVTPGFAVRRYAPDVPLLGNLGVAQVRRGYGPDRILEAIDAVGADGLALHANPLQEALQEGGDGDFRDLLPALRALPAQVGRPLLVKEVGHGLDAGTVASLASAGYAAFDVAGAGGTSWARVEAYVRWGAPQDEALVEWGIPTATALRRALAVADGTPLIASGGIRSGLDIAKAIASGASWCASAWPLLRPATESADAVEAVLRRWIEELRVAMHVAGAADLRALRAIVPVPRER
ncbi:MAG: type 2 isopentenyl-diphosphate Delta-isomerase [Trueperaceae bacterium]